MIGWTGGFCLVALLLAAPSAPVGQFTVADFMAERFDSPTLRLMSAAGGDPGLLHLPGRADLRRGLITTAADGPDLRGRRGVFVGLGGVLVCSFLLGGMRGRDLDPGRQYRS